MSRTVSKALGVVAFGALLAGCGVTQSVSDATSATARSIFYKQVKTLHLDLNARTAMNTDGADMNALSVPTLVRVYQLRDRKALDKAAYDGLLNHDDRLLGDALLGHKTLVVKPGEGALLGMPLDKDAQVVAVVALLREPDNQQNTWRLILGRDELDPDRARVIHLGDNRLTLQPLAED
ncbi:type VI secretion system lipoprotein TssJ [Pseudomonas mandelii]|uniref:type VI secretion system lipoprotein TssJ n=1 Tax=Pseudomonas mandelii TaxID=75612 RepID=UPI00224B54D5|nr:type VI secretion system lipoprotein TssJ [Pseudomonas mandelii]MCX2900415.1 type VI secretion system lipoprotein TssJ [Pseudomonas mandelii]